MSDTAILERAPRQAYTSLKDRLITPAEEAHKQRIADNFRKLRFANAEAYNSARAGEPVAEPVTASAVKEAEIPSAAARIAQYTPIVAPAGNHDLFGEYVQQERTTYAPQQQEVGESVLTAVPAAPAIDDDDVVPTRRTMDTLTRPAAKEAEGAAAKTGILAMLSTKTKAVLATVCAIILLALVLIGVNSGVIRSIDMDIAAKQSQLAELARQTQSVQEQIANLTSPESVAEWAAKNNMTLGQ